MSKHIPDDSERWTARAKRVWIGFGVIGAFFLLSEHRAHLLPFVPWLLLLACPLMHAVMHGRHRHSAHRERDGAGAASQRETPPTGHSAPRGERS